MTDKQLAEKLEQVAAEANGMTTEQQAYILGTVQGIALARKVADLTAADAKSEGNGAE